MNDSPPAPKAPTGGQRTSTWLAITGSILALLGAGGAQADLLFSGYNDSFTVLIAIAYLAGAVGLVAVWMLRRTPRRGGVLLLIASAGAALGMNPISVVAAVVLVAAGIMALRSPSATSQNPPRGPAVVILAVTGSALVVLCALLVFILGLATESVAPRFSLLVTALLASAAVAVGVIGARTVASRPGMGAALLVAAAVGFLLVLWPLPMAHPYLGIPALPLLGAAALSLVRR